jgi:hypothetical protein
LGFFGVKILKFFDVDPGSGLETVRIRDPGWKKVGSGIRDKHPGSATLAEGINLSGCWNLGQLTAMQHGGVSNGSQRGKRGGEAKGVAEGDHTEN